MLKVRSYTENRWESVSYFMSIIDYWFEVSKIKPTSVFIDDGDSVLQASGNRRLKKLSSHHVSWISYEIICSLSSGVLIRSDAS